MKNKQRVYLLGAGVNMSLKYYKNRSEFFSPPLNKNFFNIALKITKHIEDGYDTHCGLLADYIEKYWKKKKEHLINSEFDLEECFTLLHLQMREALHKKENNKYEELNEIYFLLVDLFVMLLKEFKWSDLSPPLLRFGEILYEEEPTIITFNYDDFIEISLEHASGRKNSSINSSHMFPNQINKETNSCSVEMPIVFDNKESSRITKSDLEKAKRYRKIHRTNYVIIVSKNLPGKACYSNIIAEKDDILLVHPSIIVEFVRQVRKFLIDLSNEKISQKDRNSKESKLFTFIRSHDFARRLSSVYDIYKKNKEQQVKEEKEHQTNWRTRDTLNEQLREIYVDISSQIASIFQSNSATQ